MNKDGVPLAATYEMGIVSTGRSRVFAGHFVGVTLPSGTEFSGEDEHSLRAALRKLDAHLGAVDLELRSVGLDPRFSESGLSVDTGWGYVPGEEGAVHMMDVPPERECSTSKDDDIDQLVRDAVKGMRIGIFFKP
ncbi:hypothetical protein [Sphingomonas carotinifaciens]|uniref:hypothetical protein n=1 Tax=Sphingomonas carotinifaciens TaxID=1166323 RepID=UPI00123743EA|nr:hypothetical protein [Sphingomonas carotinifaciens]